MMIIYGILAQKRIRSRQNMTHARTVGVYLPARSFRNWKIIIHLGLQMKMIKQVIGSVEQNRILNQFLGSFFLLQVTVTALTAMPTVEAAMASIGRPERVAAMPSASSSIVIVAVSS